MSKRREFLIRLLLITVIIFCSIHASCGQENDTVNISHPSSLPAKSELSQEDILNSAQRSLDRSISIFNLVAIVMGLLVALITVIVAILGIWGYFERYKIQEYRKQVKKSAEETKSYEEEAKKAAEEVKPIFEWVKKEYEEARDTLGEKIKQYPSPPEPFSEDQKGIVNEYDRKIGALEAFGVPLRSEDYLNRGVDLYLREEYELALKAYDKAIELNTDYANAWNNRGVVLDELGRYDEALKAFDNAIELQPNANVWNNRGVVLGSKSKLGRYDEALEAYNKASELEPDYAEAWYNQACIYSIKEDKENALKHLSKAIALDAKYKEKAKSDEDFKNLWDDEDFKRIVS